ncbi:MAG TPA: citrate/2-methylcitrate synthase [Actinomycetes bacterium]|jgi:citrate synthase|nr:citrate/2-methylcitrate synthase [Actinomycetes bacterium]
MTDGKGKGLEGVVAAQTCISDIDGQRGRLFYAGYDIADLAEHASFEETTYLLHHLELPTRAQLDEVRAALRAGQHLDPALARLISTLGDSANPMTLLRTVVSAAASLDAEVEDASSEANLRKAYRLVALTPQVVAACHRLRTGGQAVEPREELSLAGNFLYALTGKEPDVQLARDFDVCLVLYADHTMNASTFAGRVAAGTLADIYAAATAAIATLQGPLHGGAIEQVRRMLDEVGTPDRAADYVRDRLARKLKVMGFGHRVYKTWDPRARILRQMSQRIGQQLGDSHWFEISERIQQTVLEEKGLYPNVDFYTASVYSALGLPPKLYTTLFASARMAGWTAHIREQYADNRLIRPDSEYVGPAPRRYQEIDQRG